MLLLEKLDKILDAESLEEETKESLVEFLKELRDEVEKEDRRIKYPFELFGIECGYGWYGLILPIYMKITKYNKNKPENEQIHIDQIKEKFGGLRFYISNAPREFYDMIDEAEELSYKVCELCGSPIDVTTEGRSWVTTQCKKCRTKKND